MATLPELARETGLDPVVCSACGQPLRTAGVLRSLFDLVLARLKSGEPVKIRGFGTFRPGTYTPKGFARGLDGPRRIVRFTLTPSAKRVLNRSES